MNQPDVIVIGAGVFGAWTALELQRSGHSVLVVDAFGVGHARASSGGESRVIRMGYEDRAIYSKWAAFSLQQWKALQSELETTLFVESGVLWMAPGGDQRLQATRQTLRRLEIQFDDLSLEDWRRQFPQFAPDDVEDVLWESGSGILFARYAIRQMARKVIRDGGLFRLASAMSPAVTGSPLESIRLSDGARLSAASYVFCCGPWMPSLFPDLLGSRIKVSRQEVFFFGAPPASQAFLPGHFPAWIDLTRGPYYYGLPAVGGRSMKVACDRTGPEFDPTGGERAPDPEEFRIVRDYVDYRFPALKEAPLLESRVCQYSRSPTSHLIVDRHPECSNVILAGAGSGHGFKLGPAVGRLVRELVTDPESQPPPEVALGR